MTLNISGGFIGIGAGETIEEAVCRGLQAYLDEKLRNRKDDRQKRIFHVQLGSIEDQSCRVLFKCPDYLKWYTDNRFERGYIGLPCHKGKVEWSKVY